MKLVTNLTDVDSTNQRQFLRYREELTHRAQPYVPSTVQCDKLTATLSVKLNHLSSRFSIG